LRQIAAHQSNASRVPHKIQAVLWHQPRLLPAPMYELRGREQTYRQQ
jgi:hypothetical protein